MNVMIENLGRNIKALRIRNNLSQQDLAEALEISIGSISKIERGVTYPSFTNLERIARILHTNAAELFSDDEQGIQSLGEVSIRHNMSSQVDLLARIRAVKTFQEEREVQCLLADLLNQIFEIAEREQKKTIYETLNRDFFTLLNQLNIEQVYQEVEKIREAREHEKQRVYKREDKK